MSKRISLILGCAIILGLLTVGLASAGNGPPWDQTEPVNMGPSINTANREAEPTFTADGKTMYYNCTTEVLGVLGNDICVSYKEKDGNWSVGEPLPYPVNTVHWEVEPLVSINDDNKLYFMSSRPGGLGVTDIWVTRKVDGQWTEPENLGMPINSASMDHCLYFTGPDENTAYFTSMRSGGYGGNDIWMTKRVNGVWQDPVNLGPNVNTPFSEHHSVPSPDGKSLYVTSDRPGGLGGEDIYVTTMDAKGDFGPMQNLGPLVNSNTNDRCPAFTPDFSMFVFDSERAGGHGNKDLWWIYYENIKHIR